jgi:molecular chaperone DnaK
MTRPILGIDLGTTYSCVAHLDEFDRPAVIQNSDGQLTTPSVVYFESPDSVVVGETAKNELRREPDRVVDLIKRHMGEEDFSVPVDGREYSPQRISAIILRKLVEGALETLGTAPEEGPLADVVITVPAYFGAAERQATRDAGKIAGLEVVNIINEPTAAAIAYGAAQAGAAKNVLVYDLGGGTFDVTVITVTPDEVRVVATDGHHHLGGADWDTKLVDLLAERFAAEHPDKGDPRGDEDAVGELTVLAEQAKKNLSTREVYRTAVTAHGERASVEITRAEFEDRSKDLVERTLAFTEGIIGKAAEKGVTAYDAVLLVGGMSRAPAIARELRARFPQLPEPKLSDPDLIVAKGAALFAAHAVAETSGEAGPATGSSSSSHRALPGSVPRIVNVTSKGYGVKVVDGPHDQVGQIGWLLRPNEEIPAAPRDTFSTVHDNQDSVNIEVYESPTTGLDDAIQANKLLVQGLLSGMPPNKPAGQPIIVDFALGDDGILRISAQASNGKVLRLEAKISGATSEEDLNTPLPVIQR